MYVTQEAANGRGDAGKMEGGKKDKGGSKLSVERVYQKKTQLEHILLRPDTYIGSVEPITQVSHQIVIRIHWEFLMLPSFFKRACGRLSKSPWLSVVILSW